MSGTASRSRGVLVRTGHAFFFSGVRFGGVFKTPKRSSVPSLDPEGPSSLGLCHIWTCVFGPLFPLLAVLDITLLALLIGASFFFPSFIFKGTMGSPVSCSWLGGLICISRVPTPNEPHLEGARVSRRWVSGSAARGCSAR